MLTSDPTFGFSTQFVSCICDALVFTIYQCHTYNSHYVLHLCVSHLHLGHTWCANHSLTSHICDTLIVIKYCIFGQPVTAYWTTTICVTYMYRMVFAWDFLFYSREEFWKFVVFVMLKHTIHTLTVHLCNSFVFMFL